MIEISKHTILAAALIWLFVCSLRGYYKGFLREAYTVAQIVIALVCLWALARRAAIFTGGIPTFGGFLVILFILRWIGRLLDIVNHIPILGGMNRTLGVLLGFCKGLLVIGLVYSWLGNSISV
ncbi:MAG: CvpA family protein [Lachnospiraceae bacterium]|nr:CvpA family protein [Lachnospiraceae bacterium]MDD7178187.1 CvpA family protein [bacterium]MDY5517965.1 CvpA family protein [Lachnospiraceae bacterium]